MEEDAKFAFGNKLIPCLHRLRISSWEGIKEVVLSQQLYLML